MDKYRKKEKIAMGFISLYLLSYFMMLFDFSNLLTVLIGGCICILIWIKHKKIEIGIGNSFLIIMLVSYYIISYGIKEACIMGLPYVGIIIALLGTCLSSEARAHNDYEELLYGILFLVILGFSIHGFLNSYMYFAGFRSEGRRHWYDFWMRIILPATEQVIYFLPILSTIFPAMVYFKNRRFIHLFYLLSSVFFIYLSWISDSRTPIFIFPLVMAAQSFLYIILEREKLTKVYQKNKTYVVAIILAAVVGLLIFVSTDNRVLQILTQKLGRSGGVFGSVRFKAQRMALEQLLEYPMGGGKMNFGRTVYAHNTWLDMANRAGLIPFFSFTIYTIYSIYELIVWLTKKDISTERKLITAGIYGSFFLYYTIERGIDGSMHFMTPWFLVNSMIHGELSAIKNKK